MKSEHLLTLEQQQAYTVAYLLAEQRLGQAEVGDLLHLSQATVSRRVQLAKEMGVLVENPRFIAPRSSFTNRLKQQWDRPFAAYEAKLKERYGADLRRVRVFTSRAGIESRDHWDRAVVAFGQAAARDVFDIICRSKIVGIAYGRTQKAVVWGLRDLLEQIPADRPKTRFIPLWGSLHGSPGQPVPDPHLGRIFTSPNEISSDFMAKELNELLHESPQAYALEAVPSFLPPGFFQDDHEKELSERPRLARLDAERRKAVLDLFQHPRMSEHGRIFGSEKTPGEIADASALFVTVSSPTDLSIGRFYHARLMAWLGLDEEQMREHFLGDIGSVLIGKGAKGERLAASLDALSLCLTYKHLADCARTAREKGNPGVVAFAVGKARAAMLHESIRCGLVNEALIDQNCAAALCRL